MTIVMIAFKLITFEGEADDLEVEATNAHEKIKQRTLNLSKKLALS